MRVALNEAASCKVAASRSGRDDSIDLRRMLDSRLAWRDRNSTKVDEKGEKEEKEEEDDQDEEEEKEEEEEEEDQEEEEEETREEI